MMTAYRIAAGVVLAAGTCFQALAAPITVAPTAPPSVMAPTCTTNVNGGQDETFLSTTCGASNLIELLYKQDVSPAAESGSLAPNYTTTFNGDQSGGTIVWNGPAAADCLTGTCWLVVKDGNQTPARYGYNLAGIWDGVSTITLTGFWPDNGAISHVGLYGFKDENCSGNCQPSRVPEPTSIALFGLALTGLAVARRRRV